MRVKLHSLGYKYIMANGCGFVGMFSISIKIEAQ